MPIPDN